MCWFFDDDDDDDAKWWHENDVKRLLKEAHHEGFKDAMNLLGKRFDEHLKVMKMIDEALISLNEKIDNMNDDKIRENIDS